MGDSWEQLFRMDEARKAPAKASSTAATISWVTRPFLLCWVRTAVVFAWVALGIGGIMLMGPTTKLMVSSVDPPSGTAAYTAMQVQSEYYPGTSVEVTILVSSKTGEPIINTSSAFLPEVSSVAEWHSVINGSVHLPVGTPLTASAMLISEQLENITLKYNCSCPGIRYLSYFAMRPLVGLLTKGYFFDADGSSMLVVADVTRCNGQMVSDGCVNTDSFCSPIVDLQTELLDWANNVLPASELGAQFTAAVISTPLINEAVNGAIEATLDLSTKTFPLALLVLGLMLLNARLLLLPCAVILLALGCSFLCVYPIAKATAVSSTATSLMLGTGLAMSIDYALFLNSR